MKPNLHLVAPDEPPAPKPPIEPRHTVLPPAARHAFTGLEGRFGDLRRIFSGAATTVEQHARLGDLCDAAISELQRIKRLSR